MFALLQGCRKNPYSKTMGWFNQLSSNHCASTSSTTCTFTELFASPLSYQLWHAMYCVAITWREHGFTSQTSCYYSDRKPRAKKKQNKMKEEGKKKVNMFEPGSEWGMDSCCGKEFHKSRIPGGRTETPVWAAYVRPWCDTIQLT